MTRTLKLLVRYQSSLVGEIHYNTGTDSYTFEYDPKWIDGKKFPISPHITYQGHRPGVVKRYLENLLPEGRGLQELSTILRLPKSNTFALINSIGRDLSGALEITAGATDLKSQFRKVSREELRERIKNRTQSPITLWDGRPRLSVAGIQDKLPITKKDSEYGLGEGRIASTHILKFGRQNEHHIVLNEFFCMQLAKAVGLQVAEVQVVDLGERVLEVVRFDRQWQSKDSVLKIHVIDGCQALDIAPDHKYERFLGDEVSVKDILGPANLENLYSFSDQCINPAKTKLEVLLWTLFNLFIGNSDNHLKNISYWVNNEGLRLAPFYDLLSITIYPDINHSLSFAIGETFDPNLVNTQELFLMSHELGLRSFFVKRQGIQMIKRCRQALSKIDLNPLKLDLEESQFIEGLQNHIQGNLSRYEDILRKL